MSRIFNINVGVLGHVDSGKTSLSHALSTIASTAAFDKHPQSRERGITLDLGFSSFLLDIPPPVALKLGLAPDFDEAQVQITLVDCPGHASLIRTVIGGAHIIDLVMLVIDATKGVQTQTAECLLLANIIRPSHMILVLNKVDLLDSEDGQKSLQKLEKKLRKTLEQTSFGNAELVRVSACPGGSETIGEGTELAKGLESLKQTLTDALYPPLRNPNGAFMMSADHCFSIKGAGTILTGTVLQGTVAVGDTVEIVSVKQSRKVKGLQMFRKPVPKAQQGDRVALNLTQFEASSFERGIVCKPGTVGLVYAAVVNVQRIAYYKQSLTSKTRFHISIGHETVMGRCIFFGGNYEKFNVEQEYLHIEQVDDHTVKEVVNVWALLELDIAVLCADSSLYIASRLDADVHTNSCRLAFHGKMIKAFSNPNFKEELSQIRAFKENSKEGIVERCMDERTLVAHSIFNKQTNIEAFLGFKISLSTGEKGVIDSTFGQSGKIKLYFANGLHEQTVQTLNKKKEKNESSKSPPVTVLLQFKRYIFDTKKKMIQ